MRSRSFYVIHYVSYVGILAHALFIALFAFFGLPTLALFNVASVAAWGAARIANQRMHPRLAAGLMFTEVVAHAVLALSLLGWRSGFHYYLLLAIPFLMFNDQLKTRTVVAGSLLVAIAYVALRYLTYDVVPPPSWDGRAAFVEYMNMLVTLTALAVLSIYFRFASIAAEQAMAQLAMTDPLTRLANRRRMRDLLDGERVRFQRKHAPFAVVIADVDDFKRINDERGHDCGDLVLVTIAQVLKEALRAQDSVGRWGGEEFLILLPDTDLDGAAVVAEKLRAAVEKASLAFDGQSLKVTMTFGIATHAGTASVDDCVRRADEALYAGKSLGKNCVTSEPRLASA